MKTYINRPGLHREPTPRSLSPEEGAEEGAEEVAPVGDGAPAVVHNLHLWTENAMQRWQRLRKPVVVVAVETSK